MTFQKQVDAKHYGFRNYMRKPRWISIWHQLDQLHALQPTRVLEVGGGSGLLKIVAANFGMNIDTVDIDPDLKPDYVASALDLPFEDNSYDVTCAFQMLEHLPFPNSVLAFNELVRVARSAVLISLPDASRAWRYAFRLPKLQLDFLLPLPNLVPRDHLFDGEHYWELGKRGYSVASVVARLTANNGSVLEDTFRVLDHPYHRFFRFSVEVMK